MITEIQRCENDVFVLPVYVFVLPVYVFVFVLPSNLILNVVHAIEAELKNTHYQAEYFY